MKLKRFSFLFAFVLALSTFFSSAAFAEETEENPNLVALGDSITFGYKLEEGQTQASPNAFPNLIADGLFNVTNFGVPGWRSDQLLDALNNNAAYGTALQNADVITLDIGNNDLLQAADLGTILSTQTPVDPVQLQAKVGAAVQQLGVNLQQIVAKVREFNPEAPIILYNLYNPFGESTDQFRAYLHSIGDQITTSVNTNVIAPFEQAPGVFVADAYTAFDGHQSEYILATDPIHPNLAGHQALADLATDILFGMLPDPLTIELTPSTTEATKDPVTVTVTTNSEEPLEMLWLPGEKTVDDFIEAGNEITDNQFQVTENGVYTVFVMDEYEQMEVATIEISNISKDEPTNPTPTDNDSSQPTPAPTPTTAPADSGNKLPDTASAIYNYLALGLILIAAGFVTQQMNRRRRENV